jgi:hypothetical protein
MPRRFQTRFTAFALTLCAGFGACESPTNVSRQLVVEVAVDRVDVAPTNPADIAITIINRGRSTVQTADPRSYACSPSYLVLDAAGRSVLLPGRFCLAIAYAPRDLAPGDSITVRDRWSADMTDGHGGATVVTPGQYRIVARIFAQGSALNSEPVLVSVRPSTGP